MSDELQITIVLQVFAIATIIVRAIVDELRRKADYERHKMEVTAAQRDRTNLAIQLKATDERQAALHQETKDKVHLELRKALMEYNATKNKEKSGGPH